jgi:hypothetical protein
MGAHGCLAYTSHGVVVATTRSGKRREEVGIDDWERPAAQSWDRLVRAIFGHVPQQVGAGAALALIHKRAEDAFRKRHGGCG